DFNGRILMGSCNLAGDSSLRSERRYIFNGTAVGFLATNSLLFIRAGADYSGTIIDYNPKEFLVRVCNKSSSNRFIK
ncbi:hypothetical protein Lmor_1980, partial [Legionella moravica]